VKREEKETLNDERGARNEKGRVRSEEARGKREKEAFNDER
jgi:hypothetical protein